MTELIHHEKNQLNEASLHARNSTLVSTQISHIGGLKGLEQAAHAQTLATHLAARCVSSTGPIGVLESWQQMVELQDGSQSVLVLAPSLNKRWHSSFVFR